MTNPEAVAALHYGLHDALDRLQRRINTKNYKDARQLSQIIDNIKAAYPDIDVLGKPLATTEAIDTQWRTEQAAAPQENEAANGPTAQAALEALRESWRPSHDR